MPIMPTLLVNDKYVSDFKTKADLLNIHFSNQCSLIENNSCLPQGPIPVANHFLNSIEINGDQILKSIWSRDVNKSHGFDQISARMLKICDLSIVKPLQLIFDKTLKEVVFPVLWKKANVTPIYKKGD